MPVYLFGSDVLLPYMRETNNDRSLQTVKVESYIAAYLLDYFGAARISHGRRGNLDGGMVRFHWLRKTAGQRMLEATGNMEAVQHQLGHSSLRTTEQLYTREPLDLMRNCVLSVDNQR